VPGAPFTPLISVAACLYLMLQLPRVTWIRFGLWLLLGLVIYFLYGYRHSVLRTGRRAAIDRPDGGSASH
jgi:APA family basic amino acid/polyamine antiporter